MNIAIFGDSFANGETDGKQKLAHLGLTQYLTDDGHLVVNFSKQGNTNVGVTTDYPFHLRQNEHLKFDKALVFQTETTRETQEWIDNIKSGKSVNDVDVHMIKNDYGKLLESQEYFGVPIYLIGGTVDTLSPEVIKECGLKSACQSVVNLVLTGEHTIEEPTLSFVFPLPAYDILDECEGLIDDKEYFLKIEKKGNDRYKLMLDNPEYFYPDGVHPNRKAYKILFNHLKESNII
tara:strand:+ start:210 stop:911 length:702 start_codon:yes stop_codon:yes gene_type:complete